MTDRGSFTMVNWRSVVRELALEGGKTVTYVEDGKAYTRRRIKKDGRRLDIIEALEPPKWTIEEKDPNNGDDAA